MYLYYKLRIKTVEDNISVLDSASGNTRYFFITCRKNLIYYEFWKPNQDITKELYIWDEYLRQSPKEYNS